MTCLTRPTVSLRAHDIARKSASRLASPETEYWRTVYRAVYEEAYDSKQGIPIWLSILVGAALFAMGCLITGITQ